MLEELEELIQSVFNLSLIVCREDIKSDQYLKADMNRNIDLVIANLQMIKAYNNIIRESDYND